MRKILGVAVGVGLMFLTVTPTLAVIKVKIRDTGPLSINDVIVNRTHTIKVTNYQNAKVTNDIDSKTNTGKNYYFGNTKVLGVGGTGNAISTVVVDNQVNVSETNITGCGCDQDIKVKLDQTGPGSVNLVTINADQSIKVKNKQTAYVYNDIDSKANTGKNEYIGNTKVDGVGSTGDATSSVGVANWVNTSVTNINTGGSTPTPTPTP